MWTIFKVFIEFITTLLLFWFIGREACGILAPWPGIDPAPPALEGEVLTTGPPGKSHEASPSDSGVKGRPGSRLHAGSYGTLPSEPHSGPSAHLTAGEIDDQR